MTHVSLQFGETLVPQFAAPHRRCGGGQNLRFRALHEAVAAAGRNGRARPFGKCRRRAGDFLRSGVTRLGRGR